MALKSLHRNKANYIREFNVPYPCMRERETEREREREREREERRERESYHFPGIYLSIRAFYLLRSVHSFPVVNTGRRRVDSVLFAEIEWW